MMDDVAIRNILVELVGFGERARGKFFMHDVNIDGRNICNYENNGGAYRLREW